MKLIKIEKKCINNCKNDIKYKFEYKGECYEKCPSKTKISKDDPNLCEEIKQEEKICNLKTNDLNLNNNEFSIKFIFIIILNVYKILLKMLN